MVTLQENTVKFNNHLIVSHDGGRLSSDSGLILIDELMDAFKFTQLSEAIVLFKENRKYWMHSNHKILKQLVLQIIAGNIPHPAGDINTDVVLNEFIVNGEFSQTATLNRRPYDDVGYMFKEDFIFYGAGSVTGWRDDMKGFDIHDYSMDGYEIEVVMSDQDNSEGEFSEKYFWISEDIIYKMDEDGNYTDRYEKIGHGYDDVWQFYHNLPDHQLYGQN